jgi:hypothetical protein
MNGCNSLVSKFALQPFCNPWNDLEIGFLALSRSLAPAAQQTDKLSVTAQHSLSLAKHPDMT